MTDPRVVVAVTVIFPESEFSVTEFGETPQVDACGAPLQLKETTALNGPPDEIVSK